jgi:signal transduction histidine kinase
VKHLVELHGGEAVAANRPDGGAVFTIKLPLG